MTWELRWRRAIGISVIVHMLFLAGAGYLAARLFILPALPESYIELELTSEIPAAAPVQAVALPAAQVPPERAPLAAPASAAGLAEPAQQSVQTTASAGDLSREAAEAPARPTTTPGGTADPGGSRSGSMAPPRIWTQVEPDYPQSARQAGIQGTALLKVQILETGRPGNILLVRSSGHGDLDAAAIAAVRKWRFIPAKDLGSGQAVACYTTLPVSFRLQ